MTAVRVTVQIALFGAALADSQQTQAGAHIGGSRLPWITVRHRRVPIGSLVTGALPGSWGRQAGLFQPMLLYLAAPAT